MGGPDFLGLESVTPEDYKLGVRGYQHQPVRCICGEPAHKRWYSPFLYREVVACSQEHANLIRHKEK